MSVSRRGVKKVALNTQRGKSLERDYNTPLIDGIDDEDSMKIKRKRINSIKGWSDTGTNVSDRDLSFLNKSDFVKIVSFDSEFRKAIHENILKPVLIDCLPSVSASADIVSAVAK
eukprot:2846004-Ditylum_brightwellii.AAC.1